MSREHGTPPNKHFGLDFGPVGNHVFNERIFMETMKDFPSPHIQSRKELERISRKKKGKPTAADKIAATKQSVSTPEEEGYRARRRSRQTIEVA